MRYMIAAAVLVLVSSTIANACTGDFDNSGSVDVDDVLALISAWGPCESPPCATDINSDDQTDVDDLLALLSVYGPCSFKDVTGCGVMQGILTEGACGRATDDDDPNGFHEIRNLGGIIMGSPDPDACALFRDVDFTLETYVVDGDTLEEVSENIFERQGTLEDGRRYAGSTKLSAENLGEFAGAEGQKLLYQLTEIRFSINMRLPEWNPTDDVPPTHVKEWHRFLDAVQEHEMRHVQIYKEVLEAVKEKLENEPAGLVSVPNVTEPPYDENGNPNDTTWEKIWNAANAVIFANPNLIEAQAAQEQYDAPRTKENPKGTDHGRLQGATLNTNP